MLQNNENKDNSNNHLHKPDTAWLFGWIAAMKVARGMVPVAKNCPSFIGTGER